jgi:hypothetical protein
MKNTRWWYTGILVIALAFGSGGILTLRSIMACDDEEGCQVDKDMKDYNGYCHHGGWNCHGVTSHAHGGEGGMQSPSVLGLRWSEMYNPQPIENGVVGKLNKCDILVFGIEIPDDPPPAPDDSLPYFPHSATATGEGSMAWQAGEDATICGSCAYNKCMHVQDANKIKKNPNYYDRCIVFPGSAFGE